MPPAPPRRSSLAARPPEAPWPLGPWRGSPPPIPEHEGKARLSGRGKKRTPGQPPQPRSPPPFLPPAPRSADSPHSLGETPPLCKIEGKQDGGPLGESWLCPFPASEAGALDAPGLLLPFMPAWSHPRPLWGSHLASSRRAQERSNPRR